MPGPSSLALALALALAPGGRSGAADRGDEAGPQTLDECAAAKLDFFLGYGAATAPTLLKIYIDPIQPNQLQLWLEARRVAGERKGELRIEMLVTRGGLAEDPQADPVRQWFMAVAALGKAEDALRLLERQDWQRTAALLGNDEGRATLAAALEIDPAAVEARRAGAGGACLARRLDRSARALASHTMGQPATIVGIVDADGNELPQYVDLQLAELRPQIDRAHKSAFFTEESLGFVPFGPTLGGQTSRLDRTFPETGVLLGGRALPHRLLVFVEDEESGKLPGWLEPALDFRTQHPGALSVQVIAAGVGTRAVRLRRRLCAARTLGLEVEFMLHLSQRPAIRRLHEAEIDEVLQPIADSDACSDTEVFDADPSSSGDAARGTDFGHPRGAWLDGRPVNRGDLENLEWQLGAENAPSLIDWLSQPEALEVFEF